MDIETVRSKLEQVTKQRERAGAGFFIDLGVTSFGSYLGIVYALMGKTQLEANSFATGAFSVSIVAAGAALWRLGQAIIFTRERDNLWKEERELLIRNRPSTLPPANPI